MSDRAEGPALVPLPHGSTWRLELTWAPYVAASLVHVLALALGTTAVAGPSKLFLMPALLLSTVLSCVVPGIWSESRRAPAPGRLFGWPLRLLPVAQIASWFGDGAAVLMPGLPVVPAMLGCFALTHVAYIWLFGLHLGRGRVPHLGWAVAAWWIVMMAVIGPDAGDLVVAVAGYGLLLGATTLAALRCGRTVTIGAVFFLASDSILAFRLFLPEASPAWTETAVMLTYTLGQGLLAWGTLRRSAQLHPAYWGAEAGPAATVRP